MTVETKSRETPRTRTQHGTDTQTHNPLTIPATAPRARSSNEKQSAHAKKGSKSLLLAKAFYMYSCMCEK